MDNATATKAPPVPPAVRADIAPPADAVSPAKPLQPLANRRLHLLNASEAGFGNRWAAVLPVETPLSHAELPEFWSLHAHKLRSSDDVRIEWDDGRGVARAFVRQVSGAGTTMSRAVVAIESYREFDALQRPPGAAATHAIEYRGPHLKYAILRLADNHIVADGYDNQQAAATALHNIVRHNPKT